MTVLAFRQPWWIRLETEGVRGSSVLLTVADRPRKWPDCFAPARHMRVGKLERSGAPRRLAPDDVVNLHYLRLARVDPDLGKDRHQ
jgi:hypothetical protein